jgi:hypothetical protein
MGLRGTGAKKRTIPEVQHPIPVWKRKRSRVDRVISFLESLNAELRRKVKVATPEERRRRLRVVGAKI